MESRRLSSAHYTCEEIQRMSEKEKEKVHIRREKYGDAMNDMKKLRDYYKNVLHEKLKNKVQIQHEKRKLQIRIKRNQDNEERVKSTVKIISPKHLKPISTNTNIDETQFSISRTYRIMRIFDACKNKSSFYKYDEDEFWKICNENLSKVEEYIYSHKGYQNITYEIVKHICCKKKVIPARNQATAMIPEEKEKISKDKNIGGKVGVDIHINDESKPKNFPDLRILQSKRERFSEKHWNNHDIAHVKTDGICSEKRSETRNMFIKSEVFRTTTERLLQKRQSFDPDLLDCSLDEYFNMKDIYKTRTTSLPTFKFPIVKTNSVCASVDTYLIDDDDILLESNIKKKPERRSKSQNITERPNARIILPLCIEDLEGTCPVKEVKIKSNLWFNPVID